MKDLIFQWLRAAGLCVLLAILIASVEQLGGPDIARAGVWSSN